MNSPTIFALALCKVYEILSIHMASFTEEDKKIHTRIFLDDLLTMCHIGVEQNREFWKKRFDKIEPSEFEFLQKVREHESVCFLSLDHEILLYRTLKKLNK